MTFDAHTLFSRACAVLCGYQSILFAIFTKAFAVGEGLMPEGQTVNTLLQDRESRTRYCHGLISMFTGIVLLLCAVYQWYASDFGDLDYSHTMRWVIPGATLTALGFQTVLSGFFVSILGMRGR